MPPARRAATEVARYTTVARHRRTNLGRGVRAAADDGAPGFYTALFGRLGRAAIKKKPKPAPAPPAVNAEPVTSAANQQREAS